MKIFPKLKHNRNKSQRAALHPLAEPESIHRFSPFGSHPVSELNDLSYEEALADMQFRRFLRAEYKDAQPPDNSFAGLMLAIREHEQAAARLASPPAISHNPMRGWSSAFALAFSRPLATRMVTGAAALAVILAVLTPNASSLLRETRTGEYYTRNIGSEANRDKDMVSSHLQALKPDKSQVYDRSALLSDDPPDTFSPPKRPLLYDSLTPASDDANSTGPRMRKE